jgi:hypothetical protein
LSFRLSPSDLTFLWDECQRCFYLKVKLNFKRPVTPFPSIFTTIDGLMKDHFQGQPTHRMHPSLPPGIVQFGGGRVQSLPISLPGHLESSYILGNFDSILAFDDGSYAVVDFKTSDPKPEHVAFYGRQLHAYTYALENPAPGKFGLRPVNRLGLFIVKPNGMAQQDDGRIAYLGNVTWLEVPRDDVSFFAFLDQVMTVLQGGNPPPASETCTWCQYRNLARENPSY